MYHLIAISTHILGMLGRILVTEAANPPPRLPTNNVRQITVEGDLMLGGLFPVHAKGTDLKPCGEIMEGRGIHRVEAMLFALDRINKDPKLLPGIDLGAVIMDTCYSPAYALNQSLDFVRDLIGTMDASRYSCPNGVSPLISDVTQHVSGVIGGSDSGVSIQVANLLRLFKIVQISPASTNADLSDKTRFEFFARTVPSDNFQARAMAEIAHRYSWNYVSLVYSAGDYGELGADAFKAEARHLNICIAIEQKIAKHDELPSIVDALVQKAAGTTEGTGARVVVLFTRNDDVKALLRAANAQPDARHLIWLASEGWESRPEMTEGVDAVAQGALVISLESESVPEFENYFLSLKPSQKVFQRNDWLTELWEYKYRCKFESAASEEGNTESEKYPYCDHNQSISPLNFNADTKVQFVIDAVYAMAHALHLAWFDLCAKKSPALTEWLSSKNTKGKDPATLCNAIKHVEGTELYQTYLLNVSFKNIVGKHFSFDRQTGDGPAYYKVTTARDLKIKLNKFNTLSLWILNYQRRIGVEEDAYHYVPVGRWSNRDLIINDSLIQWTDDIGSHPHSRCSAQCKSGERKDYIVRDERCCWSCIPCKDYEYLVNETTCDDCGTGRWPLENRSECFPLADEHLQYMEWKTPYSLVPSLIAMLGILLTAKVIFLYIKYHETPIVKASGRELSFIILGAMILCYLMTFVLLSKPTALTCGLKRVGVGFSFSLLYGAMLVKTNRIYRIFSQGRRSAARPKFISPLSQVVIALTLAGVQLLGTLLWLAVSSPATRLHHPTRAEVVLTCAVDELFFLISLLYDVILIVVCTVYAVRTRKVPDNFNETKFIGFTMYTTCIIWLSFVPIFFGTGSDFRIQTTTLCISISLSAYVALFCIFSPKLWVILFEPENNVRKMPGETMLSSGSPRSRLTTMDPSSPLLAEKVDPSNQQIVSTNHGGSVSLTSTPRGLSQPTFGQPVVGTVGATQSSSFRRRRDYGTNDASVVASNSDSSSVHL